MVCMYMCCKDACSPSSLPTTLPLSLPLYHPPSLPSHHPPSLHPYSLITGGNLAASWAILQVTGVDGYMTVAEKLMRVTHAMMQGIGVIPVSNIP